MGTLTASRMLASRNYEPLKRMCGRLALFGTVVGLVFAVLTWLLKDQLVMILLPFTNNVVNQRIIQLWPLVCIMQVRFSLILVQYGFMAWCAACR